MKVALIDARTAMLARKVPKERVQPRRRGNPNWGRPQIIVMPLHQPPTMFEKKIARLGLDERDFASSPRLREWVQEHRNHYWIPEWLLTCWGIEVES